jgi:uncharacterized membrane protein YbhN (UPF0104 family)
MSEKNRKIYHLILLFLSIALLGGLSFYVQKNATTFSQLKGINLSFALMLVALHAIDFLFIGHVYQLPLSKHQIKLNFKEWYGLSVVTELFNMILPAKGGTGLRMMYMKDKKSLSLREFFSMSFSVIVVGFTLLGIAGLLYSHYFLTKIHPLYDLLDSIFFALTISGVLLILGNEFISKVFKIKRRRSPRVYLTDKQLSSKIAIIWVFIFILYTLRVFVLFKSLGIQLHLSDSIEISFILLVVSFFQVLPGNIGVKEIITAYIGKQYGIEFETALVASLIDRALLLLFLFPVGFYYYWKLFLQATLPMPRLRKAHFHNQASTIGANLTMNFFRLPSEKRIKTFSSAPEPSESSTFPAP